MKSSKTLSLLLTLSMTVAAMNPSLASAQQQETMTPEVQAGLLKVDIQTKKKEQARLLSKADLIEKYASKNGVPFYIRHEVASLTLSLVGGTVVTYAALIKKFPNTETNRFARDAHEIAVQMPAVAIAAAATLGLLYLLDVRENARLYETLTESTPQEITQKYNEYLKSAADLQREIEREQQQINALTGTN